jgi:hypothetical protein
MSGCERYFVLGRGKSIVLLGSQAVPARPDKDRMSLETLVRRCLSVVEH